MRTPATRTALGNHALFDPVLIELADHIENPGDSYPVAGTIDAPSYSVGEKEFALDDGISYDVVLTHTGDGVLVTGLVRAGATGACDHCLEPAHIDIAGEIQEYYLFEEPDDPGAYEDGFEVVSLSASSIFRAPSPMRHHGHAVRGALPARLQGAVPHVRSQPQRRAVRLR